MFLTFHGRSRVAPDIEAKIHESPHVMTGPLIVLALGALGAGFAFKDFFIGIGQSAFWRDSLFTAPGNTILQDMHEVPGWVVTAPSVMMVAGFLIASLFYLALPWLPRILSSLFKPIYKFLLNKWYFDELYDFIFVRPALAIGRFFWKVGDGKLIDGLGPDGISARVLDVTRQAVKIQTGLVYHYAFAMLIGVAMLLTWFMFAGGVLK